MFTGIIEAFGTIRAVSPATSAAGSEIRLTLATPFTDAVLGESIAVNGVCLTVTRTEWGELDFYVSPETCAKTNLGRLTAGSRVNLERALPAGGRLSGHWVQGHVDGTATLTRIEKRGDSHHLEVLIPEAPGLARYCIDKGSITLDGISLTINRLIDQPGVGSRVELMIIPHTWDHTTLADRRAGDVLNVEVDVLAKWIERMNTYDTRFAGPIKAAKERNDSR